VGDIAQVLADVPAVAVWVLELAMPVSPNHVMDGLADDGAGGDRLREDGFGNSRTLEMTEATAYSPGSCGAIGL
jgi:hypothetical protein